MAFSYTDALSVAKDKVRFYIGDTVEDQGPRPDKRNFSNGEVDFALTEESDSVNGGVAHLFEILASEWSAYALSEREGEVAFDAKQVANEFAKRAAEWRKKPGGDSEADRSGGLILVTRTDAWDTTTSGDYS